MPAAHRHNDLRNCGATTIVVGQSTTFCEGKLWAVAGDINTDGNGQLIPTGTTVFIEGKLVIVNTPDDAVPDDLCIPVGGLHCEPMTASGSPSTFAYDGAGGAASGGGSDSSREDGGGSLREDGGAEMRE